MTEDRRPLKSRGSAWAKALAKAIADTGISPNQISILSVVMSILSMVCFYFAQDLKIMYIFGAVFIQMRLLCNLFDGMVAVEHGKKTNTGDIYNDVPDRFADLFIILGLGLAVRHMPYAVYISLLGSAFAIMTAYIRVLGRSLGTQAYFIGPMAKQHRMFLITITAVAQFGLSFTSSTIELGYYALIVLTIGSVVTCFNRLGKIIKDKEAGI